MRWRQLRNSCSGYSRLAMQQTQALLLIACLLGVCFTAIQVILDLHSEREQIRRNIEATMEILRPQAARALFDIDHALAADVVRGVANFPPVRRVQLRDDFGQVLAHYERPQTSPMASPLAIWLFGDAHSYTLVLKYYGNQASIGSFQVEVDHANLASNFLHRVGVTLLAGLLRNVLLAVAFLAFFYFSLARPLLLLTQRVSRLDPSEPRRLGVPKSIARRKDELGDLARLGDDLLNAMGEHVDRRRDAEQALMRQQRELEELVTVRTRELSAAYADLADKHQEAEAAAQAAREAKALAEQANREKTRFLTVASHDLRQPLQAMQLLTDALAAQLHGETRLTAQRLGQGVRSLRDLFNHLLDFSRLDQQSHQAQLSRFPLQDIFDTLSVVFDSAAAEKKLRLKIRPTAIWVESDRALLEQVLCNLLANALKYSQCGGILVSTRRREGRLWVEIWDTGIGIATEDRVRIFQEFEQLSNPERDRRKGLGLGLAIVRRACNLLKCDLQLKSVVGRGSCFRVAIQECPPQDDLERPGDISRWAELADSHVLIVEDDEAVAAGLESLLQRQGAACRTAASTQEAIDQLTQHRFIPDLVLCDLRLPGGGCGVSVIEQMRRLMGVSLPAIILTGDLQTEALQRARDVGMNVLHKPVDSVTLLSACEQALQQERV